MNPSGGGLFGASPQGGAFQVPGGGGSNINKPGMFQSAFGSQQQPQSAGFFQSGTFPQHPAMMQQGHTVAGGGSAGTSMFGQTPSFGQTSSSSLGQSSMFGQPQGPEPATPMSQAFGQSSSMSSSSMFGAGGGSTPAFGQVSGAVFGQTPAFGQQSAFGQQPPVFSLSSTVSSHTMTNTGSSSTTTGSFGHTPFGQPLSTGSSSSSAGLVFGSTAQGPSSGLVFGSTTAQGSSQSGKGLAALPQFSFKPSTEVLFKPIFSASPEPPPPPPPSSSSSSNTTHPDPSSSGSEMMSHSAEAPPPAPPPPLTLGFSFSQPANISAQKEPQASSSSSTSSSTSSAAALQFTFSQPAAPCAGANAAPPTEPTTPSKFSFSSKVLQPQIVAPMFGSSGFGQPSAFGDAQKAQAGHADERGGGSSLSSTADREATGESNPFAAAAARPGKGTKRKESPSVPEDGPDENRTKTDESTPTEETARHAQKRPLLRSRGPVAGLFGRALSGVLKDARREPQRDRSPAQQQPMSQAAADWTDSPAQGGQVGAPPPQAPAATREVLERELVETTTDSAKAAKAAAEPPATPPARRSQRAESSGGEGAVSPSELGELTALQVKNVPPQLNKKDLLTKHFGQYGALRTIHCRPHKNLAIVHYRDHESAARAKKKGKNLQRHELYILWQRKKQSPAEKGKRERAPPPPRRQQQEEETKAQSSSSSSSSPLRRATAPPRVPPVGGTFTRSVSSPVKKPAAARTLQQLMDSDGQQRGEEPSQDGPPPSSSSTSSSSDRPVPSSILHLIGQLAETAEDKYRLLEQKDKILRQGRSKRTDLDMSKVFVGTCPDMCPEKERYMRETRNQLSAFEVLPDTEMVDHRAAIKEYSRSSADQEEPLPHELRPLPVLSRTMDYLVTQILDQPRESTRDWYDFVWNRTRAIRKDITQQHLCCPLTVSLIEKCTRFHVHCAHHLCEERLMTFDPKINNENMTKCLQSLKEMYQDLATRGVYCPQEAEFRQYNILVKLDDGDILREVQQYHPSVRNSPEVQFAVQCFSALNCNNFVRFFKLVKSASYLPGCLLHRYFNQVRAKALKTLNVAHTVGSQRSTSFPVEDMTRMLMFRDSVEASDYMTQYGLTVSDGQVELSRTAYQEPELALSQRRSEVIQGKMSALIGQVVNGGVLPRPPQHTPVYSFDAHNKFTGGETAFTARPDVKSETTSSDVEVWPPVVRAPPPAPRSRPQTPQQQQQQDACSTPVPPPEDTTTTCSTPTLPPEADVVQRPQEQPVKVPTPPPPAPVYTDEDIVCEVDSMVEEVLGSEVNEVALSGFAYISVALAESSVQVEALVSEVVGEELRDVSSNQIRLEAERIAEEKRKVDEARRRQEREVILSHYSASLATELIQEVVDQSIRETADQQIREEQEEKEELISRCTEQQCSVLLEETLEADIALLVENVLRAELQRIRKYIKRWLDVVAVRRQLKRQMRGFPAAPCCVDPRFKLKALTPSAPQRPCMEQLARGVVNLGNAGTVTFSSTRFDQKRQEAMHQMRVQYYFQQLLNESVWRPLDLPALVMENLPNPPDRVYWKTTLLLPGDHDGHTSLEDRILSDWLEVKLGGDKRSEVTEKRPDGALQTLYVSNTLTEHTQRTHTVHVSIKVSRGPLSEDSLLKAEEGLELQGTGGLVLLLPAQDGASSPGREDADDVPLLSALLQLRQLQQVSGWHCPLPLVVLVPGGGAGGGGACGGPRLEEALMLDSLVGEGLLSEYTLMYIPETTSDLQGAQQVQQAVAWLLSRCPPSVQVSSQTLVQLVDGALTREFTSRLCVHHAERRSSALGPEAPGPVIGLYNAVLEHLATAVSSQALASLSWPPGEFYQAELRHLLPPVGWNSEGHLAWLRRALLSLQVPAWTPEPHRHASWSELCESIYQYCSLIPASRHRAPLLMSRLDHLLHSVSLRGRGSSQGVPGTLRTPRGAAETLAYEHVPWDDIVLLCIDHKMKDWPPAGPPVCEGSVTEDGEVLVYFLSETLGGFEPPEEWSEAVRRTHTLRQQRDSGAPPTSSPAFRSGGLFSRSRPGAPPPLDVTHAPSTRTHTPSDMELLPQRVLHRLHEESALSHRSTEQLRDWLNADPAEHLATPLFLPSSTLLATPSWTLPTSQHSATSRPGGEAKPEEPARKKTPPPSVSSRGSLSRRLQELQRQIAAGQEEELSFRLKLDNMMSIVDD